ncbi:MAG: aspartyl protease family protein [Bryobacteraceae bacterium]
MVELAFRISFAKRHSYAGPGDTIKVPVVLRSGEETIDLVANLDTGAAYCLFERSYAEALGLNVERGIPMSFATANSRFQAYGHEVTIGTLAIEVHSLVFFIADASIVKNVLGRHGWLDRLNVGIVDHDQRLFVRRDDASPE